jgi:protein-disulfide isomerase
LDTKQFNECLDSGKYTSLVTSQTQVLQQLGVQSTPTFVVNGQALMGAEPFETYQQLFEQELGK